MKKNIIALVGFLLIQNNFAQVQNPNLNSLIAAEFAFAAAAAELGTRDAFQKYIAEDGILFRPGPVNGKNFLSSAPKRPGLLSWYPVHAEVAKDGDIGFTTGPAEFRRDKDSAAVWFGNFCTVWQKQLNGEWKFVIDIGNSNAKPQTQLEPLKYDAIQSNPFSLIKGMKKTKPDQLIVLDKQLTLISSKIGMSSTYQKYTNKLSRLLRDDNFPIVGSKLISDYYVRQKKNFKFSPISGKISSSNDLGFTYGELTISTDDINSTEAYNYLHVWKKEGKHWIIAVDVINKIQK